MGNEFREWLDPDDAGDSSPDAVSGRLDSEVQDFMAANAEYSPLEKGSNNPGTDIALPDDELTEHGNHLSEDASAAASRNPTATVSVTDSQGTQIGDRNV